MTCFDQRMACFGQRMEASTFDQREAYLRPTQGLFRPTQGGLKVWPTQGLLWPTQGYLRPTHDHLRLTQGRGLNRWPLQTHEWKLLQRFRRRSRHVVAEIPCRRRGCRRPWLMVEGWTFDRVSLNSAQTLLPPTISSSNSLRYSFIRALPSSNYCVTLSSENNLFQLLAFLLSSEPLLPHFFFQFIPLSPLPPTISSSKFIRALSLLHKFSQILHFLQIFSLFFLNNLIYQNIIFFFQIYEVCK